MINILFSMAFRHEKVHKKGLKELLFLPHREMLLVLGLLVKQHQEG